MSPHSPHPDQPGRAHRPFTTPSPRPGAGRAGSPLHIAGRVFHTLTQPPHPLAVPAAALGLPGEQSVPLDQLRTLLLAPATTMALRNQAWSVLVERAHRHGSAWTVAAVGVALPKLAALSAELGRGHRRGAPARDELDTELLTGFLTALHHADPTTPALFAQLLRAARRAGLAWLRHQRGTDTALAEQHPASTPPPPPRGHPDLVLADAVRAGVLSTPEAQLIGATRLEDTPVAEIAARLGVSEKAIYTRRAKAEHRLAAALHAAGHDLDHGADPTFAEVYTTLPLRARTPITARTRAPATRWTLTPHPQAGPEAGAEPDPATGPAGDGFGGKPADPASSSLQGDFPPPPPAPGAHTRPQHRATRTRRPDTKAA